MASIKFVLRKNQEDKTGRFPLYIRLIKDRKTKFITTGLKLKESEWDQDIQKVKRNYPNSARMNAFLAQKMKRWLQTLNVSVLMFPQIN